MKYIPLVLLLIISSCSYKISRNYNVSNKDVIDNNDTDPIIVKKKNLAGLNTKLLGSIKLDDYGFTVNCSEKKAMELLKKEAISINANLINITKEIYPGYSSCYRCIAYLYKYTPDYTSKNILTNNSRLKVRYDSINKIGWEDFKIKLPDSLSYPYNYFSTIEIYSENRSFWNGAFKDFSTQGVFYSDVSGVKPSFATEENLEHINGLYKITHIYAKELEQFLISSNIKTSDRNEINKILDKQLDEMHKTHERYIKETEYGRNKKNQKAWTKKLTDEPTSFNKKAL